MSSRKCLTLMLPLVILPWISSCGTNTSGAAISDICLIAKPITYSAKDTGNTIAQVIDFDKRWTCTCDKSAAAQKACNP